MLPMIKGAFDEGLSALAGRRVLAAYLKGGKIEGRQRSFPAC